MGKRVGDEEYPYTYVWRKSASQPLDRKGESCRVIQYDAGGMTSVFVEFERDGLKVVTSQNALRRKKGFS